MLRLSIFKGVFALCPGPKKCGGCPADECESAHPRRRLMRRPQSTARRPPRTPSWTPMCCQGITGEGFFSTRWLTAVSRRGPGEWRGRQSLDSQVTCHTRAISVSLIDPRWILLGADFLASFRLQYLLVRQLVQFMRQSPVVLVLLLTFSTWLRTSDPEVDSRTFSLFIRSLVPGSHCSVSASPEELRKLDCLGEAFTHVFPYIAHCLVRRWMHAHASAYGRQSEAFHTFSW